MYRVDLATGVMKLISVSTGSQTGLGSSQEPSVSGDGRVVAFASGAPNLVPEDRNRVSDIFSRDLSPTCANGTYEDGPVSGAIYDLSPMLGVQGAGAANQVDCTLMVPNGL